MDNDRQHTPAQSIQTIKRVQALSVAAIAFCLAIAMPAAAQTSISHATPAPNNPAAPTTVPPKSSPSPVPAPQPLVTTGTLKGSVINNDGVPTNTNNFTGGVTLTGIRRDTGETFQAKSDPAYGGLFRVNNLRPGVYDITVPASYIGSTPYTAEQINAVTITNGQSTTLDVTVYPGTRQLTTGTPAQVSAPIAQQLARHDEYIHQLELQVDTLREQMLQLQTQLTALQSKTSPRR